jgi:hypothetical protein
VTFCEVMFCGVTFWNGDILLLVTFCGGTVKKTCIFKQIFLKLNLLHITNGITNIFKVNVVRIAQKVHFRKSISDRCIDDILELKYIYNNLHMYSRMVDIYIYLYTVYIYIYMGSI